VSKSVCDRQLPLEVVGVTDIFIRDVPDDVVSALDARAARLGLSRTEFLRRRLAQEATPSESLSMDDFVAFSATFADLGDPEVMKDAWA
jgi:plasmid stability protein